MQFVSKLKLSVPHFIKFLSTDMGVNNSDIALIQEGHQLKKLLTASDRLINPDRGEIQFYDYYEPAVTDLQSYIKSHPDEFVLQIHVIFKSKLLRDAEQIALSGASLSN